MKNIKSVLKLLLIGFFLFVLSAAVAVAGGTKEEKAEEKAVAKEVSRKYNEAPMLAELVKQGKIPPVEERLPREPMVMKVEEEIGQYGGTWRRAWMGVADRTGQAKLFGEGLVKFSVDAVKVVPNIATSWEISEGGKVYTFHIREGIKWSDGEPFTADDFVFQHNDVFLNKELFPSYPAYLRVAGEPARVEKVDDYTVKYSFSMPYGNFLEQLCLKYNGEIYAPKHYMKQFHPQYTPMDKLEKMTKEGGFTHWSRLYLSKGNPAQWWVINPEHPSIWAWKAINKPTDKQMIMERNPYFWKVDPEGNQLPYIDRMENELVENTEMIALKAVTGELDFQVRHIMFTDYTLFMENKEKGDYRIMLWEMADGANPDIRPNLTCKDPVLRKLFEDKRFRFALSLAINRDEINDIAWLGMAKPRQVSLTPNCRFYSKEWERAYAEYDPERANAFLDEIGLKWDANHKWRLRPDGKTLAVTLEHTSVFGPWPDVVELLKEYWGSIGINVAIKSEDRSLWLNRWDANEIEISVFYMDSIANILGSEMRLVPTRTGGMQWGGAEYCNWYASGGKAGEKPSGDLLKVYQLWDKIKITVDEKERDRLCEEIVELHKNNIWYIGTCGDEPQPLIVKNNFRNVPEHLLHDNPTRCPGNAEPVQFFIRQK